MKENFMICFVLCVFFSACGRHNPSNLKARGIWLQHQKVVEAAASGGSVDLEAFADSARFFDTFGITVPGDHSPVIDWYPTKETTSIVKPLRRWYQENGSRLYWDEASSKVLLRPKRKIENNV